MWLVHDIGPPTQRLLVIRIVLKHTYAGLRFPASSRPRPVRVNHGSPLTGWRWTDSVLMLTCTPGFDQCQARVFRPG